MKSKFLKLCISSSLLIPFAGNAIYAYSDPKEADQRGVNEMEAAAGQNKSAELDELINTELIELRYLDTSQVLNCQDILTNCSGLDNPNLSSLQINTEGSSAPLDPNQILVNGTSGVNWHLDTHHVLYFDAGELSRDDNWKNFKNSIHAIRVLPNAGSSKLILPSDSSSLFEDLNYVTDIDTAHFDTGKVSDMNKMFKKCDRLQNLDVSSFDTSHVQNMKEMFSKCRSLKILDLSGFNTSAVNDMQSMLEKCVSLTSLDLSGFDTIHIKDFSEMFYDCRSLKSLDLSSFNTENTEKMWYMFFGCRNLEKLDLSSFNTGSLTNMYRMFAECSSLKDLDLHSFDTSKVINMSEMFAECSSLKDLDLHNFNTGSVYNVSNMFAYCSSLQSLDLSGFDTSEIWNRQGKGMLYGCDSLKKINLSDSFFKGDMSGCNPIYQNANWVQTDNHHNFKSWLEMPETWNKEDAGWWRLADDSYVLTFESNGGTEYAHCCEADGTSIDISEYIPYKPWNTFTGWYLDPECTQKAYTQFNLICDLTLYAGWQTHNQTLTFETNGGYEMSPAELPAGMIVDLKNYVPEKEGYDFAGWYLDPECTQKVSDDLFFTTDTTLYADWKIQDRTLSFETNSRFIVHPVTVKYGSTLNLECFKLANINGQFTGWYTDPDCTIKAENILHLTSDTTLYAGWNQ